jgi:hypothetical protein
MMQKFLLATLAAFVASAPAASAQQINSPISFRGGSGFLSGSTVGMSLAYRQAIINKEITGSRPKALLRGFNDELVVVERYQNQAFPRSVFGIVGGDLTFDAYPTRSSYAFISQHNVNGPASVSAGLRESSGIAITQWISQLDDLGR